MNQILKPEFNEINKTSHTSTNILPRKQNRFYLFQFLISSFIAICFLLFLFFRAKSFRKNNIFSEEITKTYQISTLYADDSNYSASRTQSATPTPSYINPFVIGMLKIDKIGLNYPILYSSSKELLNVSICRFAGPMPNEIGNLCIAGHNYVDYKFFSRLHELEKNDIIKLYDLNGKMKKYSIIKKYEVEANNLSCTSQNTNGEMLLTLLTCNNVNGKRLVVVAKPAE